MPELPEVETICIGLRGVVLGKKIHDVWKGAFKLRVKIPDLSQIIDGKITVVSRKAKYLIITIECNGSKILYLVIHLGMSGKLLISADPAKRRHDHLQLDLHDCYLTLNDPRRFGAVLLLNSLDDELFKNNGPEPLSDEFNAAYLLKKTAGRKVQIKKLLMDNSVVVGVGNIYASESLFYAGILPTRMASGINMSEAEKLVSSIKLVLSKAISLGGSSLRDYVNHLGEGGKFQNDFAVYGRGQQVCSRCLHKIQKVNIAGRSTFFCSYCQV